MNSCYNAIIQYVYVCVVLKLNVTVWPIGISSVLYMLVKDIENLSSFVCSRILNWQFVQDPKATKYYQCSGFRRYVVCINPHIYLQCANRMFCVCLCNVRASSSFACSSCLWKLFTYLNVFCAFIFSLRSFCIIPYFLPLFCRFCTTCNRKISPMSIALVFD